MTVSAAYPWHQRKSEGAERGWNSRNQDAGGTSSPGSIPCKSLQLGHLRPELRIVPKKSRFWKVTQRRFIKGHTQPNVARRGEQ